MGKFFGRYARRKKTQRHMTRGHDEIYGRTWHGRDAWAYKHGPEISKAVCEGLVELISDEWIGNWQHAKKVMWERLDEEDQEEYFVLADEWNAAGAPDDVKRKYATL